MKTIGFRNILDLIPRKAAGLPAGQREIRLFPRFSDQPLRPPPAIGPISLEVSLEGTVITKLGREELQRFDLVEQVEDFHCVTGWSSRGQRWRGYRLSAVISAALTTPSGETRTGYPAPPPFAVASAADGQQAVFNTEDLLADNVMLAVDLNGEPLDGRHGGPLRLVSPGQYGYKNIKHLTAIDFRHEQPASTMGPKEHLRARIDREERHATLSNRMIRIPYWLMIIPTVLAAERGLRRAPSAR